MKMKFPTILSTLFLGDIAIIEDHKSGIIGLMDRPSGVQQKCCLLNVGPSVNIRKAPRRVGNVGPSASKGAQALIVGLLPGRGDGAL